MAKFTLPSNKNDLTFSPSDITAMESGLNDVVVSHRYKLMYTMPMCSDPITLAAAGVISSEGLLKNDIHQLLKFFTIQ